MNSDELISKIQQKRLIFTVTTGRSGTAYLASIFGLARMVYSVHEPFPEYADVLRSVQTDSECAREFLLTKKLPAILATTSEIYVETSHLVCKGFLEPLLALGVVPDLIIHRRSTRDVALSMLKMGTIPGRSDKGLKFYLSPEDPDVLAPSNWHTLRDYQLCYWYCLEIERRASNYKQLFKRAGARISETTLAELKTFDGLTKCFCDLDLRMKKPGWLSRLRFLRSTRIKVNESRETKKDIRIPDGIDDLESVVRENFERSVFSGSV